MTSSFGQSDVREERQIDRLTLDFTESVLAGNQDVVDDLAGVARAGVAREHRHVDELGAIFSNLLKISSIPPKNG